MKEKLRRVLPFLVWLPQYRREDAKGDLVAGLTTAVMLIPQGMAYAMLAGLPPIVGLYASTLPLIVYALFGSSRQLAVGPVAMVSLLVAAGVGTLAAPGSGEYVGYAILLALLVGVMQVAMGLGRLGFLVNFLSHPVISGFTSAAALIIGLSQLKHLLGVSLGSSEAVHEVLIEAARRIDETNLVTLAIGAGSIVALVLLQKWKKTFPRALAVVAVSSLVVWGLGLDRMGVAIVGGVPAGLPAPSFPPLDASAIEALLPTAIVIALVGFMESISVAKAFARRHRYEVDANQELIGLGAANLAAGFFSGYPVTGGFSRTAVNAQAGARTGVAAIVTAVVIVVTLLFLTPLFYFLPKAVLAAIIMTAVFGLIDVAEVRHLWHVKKPDLALLALTFVATLALGIEIGIGIGVGASLLVFVVRTTRPHVAVLGRLPSGVYRNVKRHPEAERVPGVLAVRLDAQFYFGNVNFLKETLKKLEDAEERRVRAVVIDASGVNQLDSSAESALREIHADYAQRELALFFANVKGPVWDVMERAEFVDRVGRARFFDRVEDAIDAARAIAERHAGEDESEKREDGRSAGGERARDEDGERPAFRLTPAVR